MPIDEGMESSKPITPRVHAVLDYGVAATFLLMGFRYRRTNPNASLLAMINAGMVLALSVMTDYPGGLSPVVSFKTHRTIDVVQAAIAGLGPLALGFADTPEARTFYGQALGEAGVIALTDWDQPTHRAP